MLRSIPLTWISLSSAVQVVWIVVPIANSFFFSSGAASPLAPERSSSSSAWQSRRFRLLPSWNS